MLKHSTSRWLAGVGVVAALVATAATPALAAPTATATVTMSFADTTMALGATGVSRSLGLTADQATVLRDVEVRYDYRALAGKVTLKSEGGNPRCTAPEPGILVCSEESDLPLGPNGGTNLAPLIIAPTAKAEVGDSGDLKITLRAADGQTATATAPIRIAEGVDLVGAPHVALPASAPGGKFTAPLTVSNAGDKAVKGFVAVFNLPHAFRTDERFSNCRYDGGRPSVCQFDEELPAGEGRTATLNFYLGKDTNAPTNQSGGALFMTTEDFENSKPEEKARARAATPGDGPRLTLHAMSKKAVGAAQTDTNPNNNYNGWTIKVNGKNGVDLEAIGDTVQGKAGAVVTATVGFRNNGPATLDRVNGDNEAPTHLDVELPPGTAAVETPDNCWLRQGSTRKYLCASGMLLVAGETYPMKFRLRIDKVVPDARGVVRVNAECECPGGGGFDDDIKPANDKTWLVVNAADNGDGGEGGGGSLPITGTPTGLIAGIGGLLLVAGIGGYLLARRRRTRFVA